MPPSPPQNLCPLWPFKKAILLLIYLTNTFKALTIFQRWLQVLEKQVYGKKPYPWKGGHTRGGRGHTRCHAVIKGVPRWGCLHGAAPRHGALSPGLGSDFADSTPQLRTANADVNKQGDVKLKSFCAAPETVDTTKRWPKKWEEKNTWKSRLIEGWRTKYMKNSYNSSKRKKKSDLRRRSE